MKVVLQRVEFANLSSGEYESKIREGLLIMVGVSKYDTPYDVNYLASKIAGLRIFKDENNKLNKSVLDVNGEIMVVSNFTLMADSSRGTRPDFTHSATKDKANQLYLDLCEQLRYLGVNKVEHGNFGEYMEIDVKLLGPITLVLESEGRSK